MFSFEINRAICGSHYILSMVYDTQNVQNPPKYVLLFTNIKGQKLKIIYKESRKNKDVSGWVSHHVSGASFLVT